MMNNEELLKSVVVKVTVTNGEITLEGSGVIVQNKYDECFVITAEHCIFGKQSSRLSGKPKITIKYKKLNSKPFTPINVKGIVYSCPNIDVAVISIEKRENINIVSTSFSSSVLFKSLCFRGFPKWLNNEKAKTYDCVFEEYDEPKFIIKSQEIQDSTQDQAIEETAYGLSGSGLFQIKNARLFLLGIVTDLRDSNGIFGHVQCAHVGTVLESLDFDVIPINNEGKELLEQSKDIDKLYFVKKIESFRESDTDHYNNLRWKCAILYTEEKADIMASKLLEKYFQAEIEIKSKIKIDGFIQEDFDRAKFDLKNEILFYFNEKRFKIIMKPKVFTKTL